MISLNRLKLRFTLDSLPIIIIIIIIHCFDWREYFLVTPKDSLMLDHDNNIHEYDISRISKMIYLCTTYVKFILLVYSDSQSLIAMM